MRPALSALLLCACDGGLGSATLGVRTGSLAVAPTEARVLVERPRVAWTIATSRDVWASWRVQLPLQGVLVLVWTAAYAGSTYESYTRAYADCSDKSATCPTETTVPGLVGPIPVVPLSRDAQGDLVATHAFSVTPNLERLPSGTWWDLSAETIDGEPLAHALVRIDWARP